MPPGSWYHPSGRGKLIIPPGRYSFENLFSSSVEREELWKFCKDNNKIIGSIALSLSEELQNYFLYFASVFVFPVKIYWDYKLVSSYS